MRLRLDRREALLLAIFPFLALSLLNHFYKAPLYAAGPAWLWAADAVQFVLVPTACWLLVLRPAAVTLPELGMESPCRPSTCRRWSGWACCCWPGPGP
jgi:hypothetical protein